MRKYGKKRGFLMGACALLALGCAGGATAGIYARALISPSRVDLIAASSSEDWFNNGEGTDYGEWAAASDLVTVDAYGTAYSMEGATYLTSKGRALGAYEMEASFVVSEINDVENPMIGIIPWYVDEENYLFVQLKFTWSADYQTTDEEKEDGYGLQEIIVSGRLNGEAKYNSATAQQENTVFDAKSVTNIASAKRNPKSAEGHTLKVEAENSGSSGNFMKFTVYYNGASVGSVSAYYYNKVTKTAAMGFMAQDVKATFKDASFTDGYAENKTASLARDWAEKDGYTYRTLNGYDAWTFNNNGTVSFKTTETADGKSAYGVTGSNFGGYNTNRGYTANPYAATADGLPQNYEVSATFKADEILPYTKAKEYKLGYGLIAWMKDDQNFVSATIRRTESGKVGLSAVKYEVVLYGWINCSNLGVGSTVYALPEDFDPMQEHTLRVEKKSVGFFVYLDDGAEPVISKRIAGTSENYYYGYEGYNVDYTASAITGKAIYSAYDEISSYGEGGEVWKNAGKSKTAWTFADGKISVKAKETGSEKARRSYLLGSSDVSDKNVTLTVRADVSLGSDGQYSELMLSPYMLDEQNFVRAGLAWKDGKTYARIYSCTYTEEDEFENREPQYTVKESEIAAPDLTKAFSLSVKKVGKAVGILIDDKLVYGREIADIDAVTSDIGVYVYNMDLTLESFITEGYKKYTQVRVGDWLTSGVKHNQWTINSDGWLLADATYTEDMTADDKDDDKSWALQANPNGDYTLTAKIRVTKESRAEDRVGLVLWYLDESNYLIFYMDRWRADSAVARTTLTGLINGEYLPTRYTHGGWFLEGEKELENGMTRTEMSQLDQWHTITVVKTGSTFACNVDGEMGFLTYTVASGLPSAAGKTVYSGIYALNDAIEVSEWAITPAGQTVSVSTPASPSQATSGEEAKLELGAYIDKDYTDEFDGKTTTAGGDTPNPPDPDSSSSGGNSSSGGGSASEGSGGGCKSGCGGVMTGGFAGLGLAAAAGILLAKKKRS